MKKGMFALGAVLLGYWLWPQNPHLITWGPGGSISEHYEYYVEVRQSGRPVRLDGMCLSACTFLIGLVPADRVCATPNAILGFHSAFQVSMLGPEHSSEGTRLLWQTYPQHVREMLLERGWNGDPDNHREVPTENKHPEMIYIAAPDIYKIWRPCST